MTIRPVNGAKPTPGDCYALAVALKSFGFHAHVRTEEADDGYQRCIEVMVPVEFGIKKAAPSGANTGSGQEGGI